MKFDRTNYLPLRKVDFLSKLNGSKITKVERLFPKGSFDSKDKLEGLDGVFVMGFDNGKVLCVDSSPELEDSLLIYDVMPPHIDHTMLDRVDCSEQSYWRNKIGQTIKEIKVVRINGIESGLEVRLESNDIFYIYDWDDDLISTNDLSQISEENLEFVSLRFIEGY